MRDELHPNVFREVNERIAEITGAWHWVDPQGFLCECADGGCTEAVWLTRAQYTSIRADRSRFITAPGHEQAGDPEPVVAEGERAEDGSRGRRHSAARRRALDAKGAVIPRSTASTRG